MDDEKIDLLEQHQIRIPDGLTEASKVVWSYYTKFANARRAISDDIRDLIKDARKEGLTTDEFRTAMRLDGMTPEKREQWAKNVSAAALVFGYSKLGVAEDGAGNKTLKGFVEVSRKLRDDRKDMSLLIRALGEAAISKGVDFEAMKEVLKAQRRAEARSGSEDADDVAPQAWFSRVDALGVELGLW